MKEKVNNYYLGHGGPVNRGQVQVMRYFEKYLKSR